MFRLGTPPVKAIAFDIIGTGLQTVCSSADRPCSSVMPKPQLTAAWLPDCIRALVGRT